WFDGGDEAMEMRGVDVAHEVMMMALRWFGYGGCRVGTKGRSVAACVIVDPVDRCGGIFGVRRKIFLAAANDGGRWPATAGVVAVGNNGKGVCVSF
nr:hypothetical protein [Tanacetum cinerariifolium]